MSVRTRKEEKILDCLIFYLIAVVIFLLDFFSKQMVIQHLSFGESIPVIQGFFNLTLVHNTGTAFGMFKNGRYIFIGITGFSIAGLLLFFHFSREKHPLWKYAFGLLLGGALGNLLDRAFKGHVIDFLDFYIGNYHWYVFNIADSAISIAVVLLFLDLWMQKKEPVNT
jgi:signal peptidase II